MNYKKKIMEQKQAKSSFGLRKEGSLSLVRSTGFLSFIEFAFP